MPITSLKLQNLRKRFHSNPVVLSLESLSLYDGMVTCILGPTGCGKSTLMSMLAGIDLDYEGTIIADTSGHFRISYQFQTDLLLPWRNVTGNILLPFEVSSQKCAPEKLEGLIKSLWLEDVQEKFPEELSTGTRQRVALARALIVDADLRIFDEPLSAQDFASRLHLEAVLRSELRRSDKISIIVTHNVEEAIVLGDRVLVLGGSPTRVVADFHISGLPEINRPVAARKSDAFASYVAQASAALVSKAPPSR